MFRELKRKNKEIGTEECLELLRRQTRGVLSVLGDGDYPYGMPMNHFYNDEDGALYFHCGKEGHRLDAIRKHDKVSFCVCEAGEREDGDWALRVRSVIVFGRIEIVEDRDAVVRIATELSHKFTRDEEYIRKEIESYASKTVLLKLTPAHICGKRVKES